MSLALPQSLTAGLPARAERLAALLHGSARPVLRPAVWLPLLAALLVPVVAYRGLDDGHALAVLRGSGVLLACAWLGAGDDPSGEVLAAAPVPFAHRCLARFAVAGALVVPAWTAVALLVHLRDPWLPVAAVGLESLALTACGLAIVAGLRAWRDVHRPAHPAALGLLLVVALAQAAPRRYALSLDQTWGPPWAAAHVRWAALLGLALAVLVVALRDPGRARRRRPRRVTG